LHAIELHILGMGIKAVFHRHPLNNAEQQGRRHRQFCQRRGQATCAASRPHRRADRLI